MGSAASWLSGPVGAAASVVRPTDLVVMVGLRFEARIAEAPGVLVLSRNDAGDFDEALELAVAQGCRSIISFGVAGGLAPWLRPGDWIVASSILDAHSWLPTDTPWSMRVAALLDGAHRGPMLGVDRVVCEPDAKRELHARTGALAVDMESHLVARAARARGLVFAVVRVVVDPAERTVPQAAIAGNGRFGYVQLARVISSLVVNPSEIGTLLRIAADCFVARNALMRARRVLGPDFRMAESIGATASAAPAEDARTSRRGGARHHGWGRGTA